MEIRFRKLNVLKMEDFRLCLEMSGKAEHVGIYRGKPKTNFTVSWIYILISFTSVMSLEGPCISGVPACSAAVN